MAERTMQLTLSNCRRHQGCDQPICPEGFAFGERRVSEVGLGSSVSMAMSSCRHRHMNFSTLQSF